VSNTIFVYLGSIIFSSFRALESSVSEGKTQCQGMGLQQEEHTVEKCCQPHFSPKERQSQKVCKLKVTSPLLLPSLNRRTCFKSLVSALPLHHNVAVPLFLLAENFSVSGVTATVASIAVHSS
jgi:hypothetical protein